MNIFFLSMRPKQAARWHANIHIVKMIVETAQLLCNVHHRAADKDSHCAPPFVAKSRIPYKESQAGHRKLGSMIWVAESLGNYRWGVELGLALCREYNRGRGRAAGKQSLHRTQAVLEWLRDHEPNFTRVRRTPVRRRHLAMPEKLKDAPNSVEAYRDYYYSKRRTMPMVWPEGLTPEWWLARKMAKRQAAKKRSSSPAAAASGASGATRKRKSPARGVAASQPELPILKRRRR
mmetsp:Transcript_54802/g.138450  ORF Transcript_54802/g.138450 Transcript_54802/m.138450 type:complete len:234 (+) Transcript_54802:83-784(+)